MSSQRSFLWYLFLSHAKLHERGRRWLFGKRALHPNHFENPIIYLLIDRGVLGCWASTHNFTHFSIWGAFDYTIQPKLSGMEWVLFTSEYSSIPEFSACRGCYHSIRLRKCSDIPFPDMQSAAAEPLVMRLALQQLLLFGQAEIAVFLVECSRGIHNGRKTEA